MKEKLPRAAAPVAVGDERREPQKGAAFPRESGAGCGKDLCVLTLLTMAVRLAWLSRGIRVTSDGVVYLTAARNLAFHHIFSHSQGAADIVPTVSHPPLYPALIALLWRGDAAPITTVALLQVAFGAATVALVYLIARDRFNRTVALVASAG